MSIEIGAVLMLVLLAAASAFFSGMETALFSISGFQLRRWKEREPIASAEFEALMENPRRVLSVILLTDTLINIALILVALVVASSIRFPVPDWVKPLVIFGIIVIICDLFPKVLALADPFQISKTAIRILRIIVPLVDPLSRTLQKLAEKMADLFVKDQMIRHDHLNDDELVTLVEMSVEEGELKPEEREMIEQIIKLGDKTAKDCMTPRVDAFTIPDTLSNEEVVRQVRLKRHGRVPVYGESPDEILGVLDVKTFLRNPEVSYTEYLEAPSFVPETMRALDLLRAFLMHPQRMAIVLDEFGGTEGVVTFNDIVEEIIGDAVPRGDEELYIQPVGTSEWLVSGTARLDDLGDQVGKKLEYEGIDTISGLIFHHLGYLPKPGAKLEINSLQLEVRQSSRKRVLEVFVKNMDSGSKSTET
jgi:putative hemolysin